MARSQWIRDISLVVGKAGGEGIELKGLKIAFDILKTDTETPNKAECMIWNLSDETAQRIKDEFDTVILNAGYEAKIGKIYQGNIIQVRRLRNNSVDKVTHIIMGDGDESYQYSMVNKTLAAGATQADILGAAMDEIKKRGVELGHVPDNLSEFELPRGKVLFRNARDIVRDVCRTVGASWSIQDHKLNIIPLRGILPGEAILISPSTGMVNPGPEQTTEGIKVRCLLNPEIRVGGTIKVEGDVTEAQKQAGKDATPKDSSPAKTASDGVYRVIECRYFGDSYNGNDWFCDILGVAMDDTATQTVDND